MKTCKTCKQEIPVALTYRDMEPREIEVAPKRMRLSSMILKFYFSIKNPMLKVMMYPLGFSLGAASIAAALYAAFPGVYYLGMFIANMLGWRTDQSGYEPIAWLIGAAVVGFFAGAYYLGKYITEQLKKKLLNEY